MFNDKKTTSTDSIKFVETQTEETKHLIIANNANLVDSDSEMSKLVQENHVFASNMEIKIK